MTDEMDEERFREELENLMQAAALISSMKERADEGRGEFIPDDGSADSMLDDLETTEETLRKVAQSMTLTLMQRGHFDAEDDAPDDVAASFH